MSEGTRRHGTPTPKYPRYITRRTCWDIYEENVRMYWKSLCGWNHGKTLTAHAHVPLTDVEKNRLQRIFQTWTHQGLL